MILRSTILSLIILLVLNSCVKDISTESKLNSKISKISKELFIDFDKTIINIEKFLIDSAVLENGDADAYLTILDSICKHGDKSFYIKKVNNNTSFRGDLYNLKKIQNKLTIEQDDITETEQNNSTYNCLIDGADHIRLVPVEDWLVANLLLECLRSENIEQPIFKLMIISFLFFPDVDSYKFLDKYFPEELATEYDP